MTPPKTDPNNAEERAKESRETRSGVAERVKGGKRQKGRAAVEKKAVALQTLEVVYAPIGSITPNEYNPNRQNSHDFDLLLKSMREDGFTQPIVVQRNTNQIVDGEHRWRAARELGLENIPVVYVDMTPEQMRIATLRHNRARGSEDIELAASVLKDLQELGAIEWAADSLNMDDAELDKLLNDFSAPEDLAGEEFSEAWAPTGSGDESVKVDGEEFTNQSGEQQVNAASTAAIDAMRARRQAIAEAKTDEERQAVAKDRAIYRLALVFANDEATVVRQALGDRPAEAILAMCRAKVDAETESE